MNFRTLIKSKRILGIAGGAVLAVFATSAFGIGAIVYDPTNYLQAVKQVQAWEQQYSQMRQTITQGQQQLAQIKSETDALTGSRGLGGILNNPLLKNVIPQDLSATLTNLNTDGSLSGNAKALRAAAMLYDCGDVSNVQQKQNCQAILGQTAQAQSIQQTTMAMLEQRTSQIDQLREQINATQDPKAIAELQARLAAEQAQVGNDQNKIAMANAMLMTSQQSAVQREHERVSALMATNKTSALDGFSFAALSPQANAQQQSDPVQ